MAKKAKRPKIRRRVVLSRAHIVQGAIAYAKVHGGVMPKMAVVSPIAWRRLVSETRALAGGQRQPAGHGVHAVVVTGVYVYALAGWTGVAFVGSVWNWNWTPNGQAGAPV